VAFSDPINITVSGVASDLFRTSSGENTGSFQKNDGTLKVSVSHQYGKRTRRTIRLEHSKIAPDPLISSANIRHSMTSYLVIDTPTTGYTVAEAKAVADALMGYLTASSGAATTKLLGGEN
jgi:hypothetical protein